MIKKIQAVNDFVVKFANVNGSGSASANELFAKSIIRMGNKASAGAGFVATDYSQVSTAI